jgi:hypothetical protein
MPELVVNSWNESHPAMAYKLAKNEQGEPVFKPWIIHESDSRVNGHGIGLSDINDDGLDDIIFDTSLHRPSFLDIGEKDRGGK